LRIQKPGDRRNVHQVFGFLGRPILTNQALSPNTVHLTILMAFRRLTGGSGMARAQWEVAHLALHAAEVAPVAAGHDALLEDFIQNCVMKGFPAQRGE
jgi:hypothetical protein